MDTKSKIKVAIIHVLVWLILGYFFVKNSYLRPYAIGAFYKEILSLIFIISGVYAIYFPLYRFLFKKNRPLFFWAASLLTIIVISLGEFILVRPNIVALAPVLFDSTNLFKMFLRLLARDIGIASFFILFRFYISSMEANTLLRKNFEVERLYLSSKIAPHYLSNAILSIQRKAHIENDEVANLLGQLNSIVQYLIKQSVKETVLLSDEIDFYRDYVLLEQDRFPDERKIDFKLSLDNVNRTAELAPLLLEPIICNAFKYSPHDGTGYVFLTVSQPDSNTLLFICTNNIIKERFHCKGCGSSLENLRKRLELCYPEKHELCVSEQSGIFTAKLKIAIK